MSFWSTYFFAYIRDHFDSAFRLWCSIISFSFFEDCLKLSVVLLSTSEVTTLIVLMRSFASC